MSYFRIFFTSLLLLYSGAVFSQNSTFSNFLETQGQNPYFLSLKRNQGRTVGCKDSYTSVGIFAFPYHYQNYWTFLDVRGHRLDSGRYAANAGVGVRFLPFCLDRLFSQCCDLIMGFNSFYDYRGSHCNGFNQVGLGFEILSRCWNFRINGYLPVGKRSCFKSCCFFDDFEGDYFLLQENFVDSLGGVDFEIEGLLRKFCWGELYGAIGPYFYKGNRCKHDIYGVQYRLSAWYCNYFEIGINATHDCEYKTRIQGELLVNIPLNCGCWDICSPMFQPVRRREIIVTNKHSLWTSNF